jgi:type IV secretion system protein VirD4
MERTPGYPAAGCPVLFVLDEFASLGHMRQIEDAAGQIAGYGVKLWHVLQDLGQLKALYKERWETFMGNAGILQFFGNNDLTTLEWVSKRLGTTTLEQQSGSVVTPSAAARGAQGES